MTMPVPKLTCPECQTVLKPTKPLPEGKKVVCPKCGANFAAGLARAPEKAPAAAVKKPKAAVKPKPTAKKKRHQDDDDADFETYGVIKEEGDDDEESKPQIEYAPDLSVKDPRGPAQAEVITPTNAILGIGILSCLLLVVGISWAVFPFLFSDYVVDHKDFLEEKYKGDKKHKIPEQRKDMSAEDKRAVDEETDLQVQLRVTLISMFVAGLVYYAVVAMAAVKMQQLESYRWSMVGAIMAMIPFNLMGLLTIPIFDIEVPWPTIMVAIPCALMLPLGIWSLVLLKNPKVRAGFEYVPE
jgi:hypothetical protein